MKQLLEDLIKSGAVEVLDQNEINRALDNEYYDNFQDFLDEAVFECWIADYPEETA